MSIALSVYPVESSKLNNTQYSSLRYVSSSAYYESQYSLWYIITHTSLLPSSSQEQQGCSAYYDSYGLLTERNCVNTHRLMHCSECEASHHPLRSRRKIIKKMKKNRRRYSATSIITTHLNIPIISWCGWCYTSSSSSRTATRDRPPIITTTITTTISSIISDQQHSNNYIDKKL